MPSPEKQYDRWKLLGRSRNGHTVVYDPVGSHAATHLHDTPQLKPLVIEVIKSLDLDMVEVATHIDMGRVIGTCDVVGISPEDEVVYGIRKNRMQDGLVPFTKSRPGEPCRSIAIHIIPLGEEMHELVSAWIGTYGGDEPFPGSPEANGKSIEYWTTHAFVYGSQEIVTGTETAAYPW